MMKLLAPCVIPLCMLIALVMKFKGQPISWWSIALPFIGIILCGFIPAGVMGIAAEKSTGALKMLSVTSLIVGAAGFVLLLVSTYLLIVKMVKLA